MPFVPRHDWEGRDWIERLSQALGEGGLVTIWGAGGTGKTTLAVEAANRFFPAPFSGGLIYASADGRPDFGCETLLNKVLADFGREDTRSLAPPPKADLVCHLLGDAVPCLLALDNFETIAKEEQQAILALLDHVSCPVLVTSRDQLPTGINLRLGPMTPPEAEAFLRSLVERSSQRARLERTDLNQVAETAERNPMLMRWVVRQLEQAIRLEDVFDELARGKGEAAERIFGRSFQLLGGDGQTALLALSLFVPTASWEALAAVCGFDLERAKGAIKQLARLDLLATEDERLGAVGLTRRLAQAQLEEDERARDLRTRFVAHFLAYAEAHAQPTPEDFNALEAEHANLLAAMDRAYELEAWEVVTGFGWAICLPYVGYLFVRGYWTEARRRLVQAVEAAQRLADQENEAAFMGNAASVAYEQGDYEAARDELERVKAIFEEMGRRDQVAVALHQLGMLAQATGDYEQAHRLYQQSLDIERELGNKAGIAQSLHQLGMLAQDTSDYEQARRLYQQSLDIRQQLGDEAGVAQTLHQLGTLAQNSGDYDQARRLYQQSLDIAQQLGDKDGIARSLAQLGQVAELEKDYVTATRYWAQALEIFEALGAPERETVRGWFARLRDELGEDRFNEVLGEAAKGPRPKPSG